MVLMIVNPEKEHVGGYGLTGGKVWFAFGFCSDRAQGEPVLPINIVAFDPSIVGNEDEKASNDIKSIQTWEIVKSWTITIIIYLFITIIIYYWSHMIANDHGPWMTMQIRSTHIYMIIYMINDRIMW